MNGENVGCVMLVKDQPGVARLRLLLVDPKARGLGLGAAPVDECVRFARAAGYRKITLWTHSILTAARHIYEKAGFTLTSSEPKHSWGQDVVAEYWDLDLYFPLSLPAKAGDPESLKLSESTGSPHSRERELQAVAPFAFGRRRCSSSRGRISTKLHGR